MSLLQKSPIKEAIFGKRDLIDPTDRSHPPTCARARARHVLAVVVSRVSAGNDLDSN